MWLFSLLLTSALAAKYSADREKYNKCLDDIDRCQRVKCKKVKRTQHWGCMALCAIAYDNCIFE